MKLPSTVAMPVTARSRRSPFWPRSHAAGGHNYVLYNHMLIAADIQSAEEDYHHLKPAVPAMVVISRPATSCQQLAMQLML